MRMYEDQFSGMVVTDLDGTLLHPGGSLSRPDLSTLRTISSKGILRVIATGRSLFSTRKVLRPSLPIDYLIFSSGAGILEWRSKRIVQKYTMSAYQVECAAQLLLSMNLEFMIHRPIPENHRFHYFGTGKDNPDFLRRLEIYRDFATMGNATNFMYRDACQIVVVEPLDCVRSSYPIIEKKLYGLSVIKTTSPIDGASTWIEIFPPSVSKSLAAEWIRLHHDVPIGNILAVGNDYNDLDLLSWARHRFVVSNAPDELRNRFPMVRSSSESGFSEAVHHWLHTYSS
jgi:HAD superfamily hydrolase (TIGR01484 family)